MKNTVLLLALGFISAYVIQEFRLRKKNQDVVAGLKRIKSDIINDVTKFASKEKAIQVAENAISPEISNFGGCGCS